MTGTKYYYWQKESNEDALPFTVYREAPSSEHIPTFIAGCNYKDHAEMVVRALNQNLKLKK